MKAELNAAGVMLITPETPTEAYAVLKWRQETWVPQDDLKRQESGYWRGSNLKISPSNGEKE